MKRLLTTGFVAALAIATFAHVSPVPAGAEEKASDPRNRIICRRFTRTGSLVDSYRTCKTRWEWERERTNIRRGYDANASCRNPTDCGK